MFRKLSGSAFALCSDTLKFYSECERKGGFLKTHVWGVPVYVLTNPFLIEEVLVTKHRYFMKSAGLRATQRGFGHGLLTADGQLWRQQRRILQPAFRSHRVEQYLDGMKPVIDRLIKSFGAGEERNIHRDMTDLCFEILAINLFGEDMARGRNLIAEAAESLHQFHEHYSQWIGSFGGILFSLVRAISTAIGHPEFTIDPSSLPTSYGRNFCSSMDALDAFVDQVIQRRQNMPAKNDLLGTLLLARDEFGKPLSKQQIRDEVVTMFFAGHETGAAALTWAFYLLAKHPEICSLLSKQIDQGKGDQLADQVMREAMRLYPPAYRISRTVIETCELWGIEVTAGAEVVIPQWAVHRSPRYYKAPNRFHPQRWTPEFIQRLPKFAYFPFGGGPRTCIGNTFGIVESKFVLTQVLKRFELELIENQTEPELQLGVTLLPKNNSLLLRLKPRNVYEPAKEVMFSTAYSQCPFQ